MSDELYMKRCLELAEMGNGQVSPNPLVGCVIVSGGKIIGEGFHQKYGQAHAEVNAIHSVIDKYGESAAELLKDAVAYVSLEPCAHFGKTPPCADLLIRHQVKKVVIGNRDPFPDVNGKGIEKLKNAGIEVVSGVLEKECFFVNRRFFTRIAKQRPYIILKWARTANGFFAPKNSVQEWISGPLAKKLVHKWRTEEDAILVGKQTAIADNPALSARDWAGKNPIRIAIDRKLEIPVTSHLYNMDAKTIIFNEQKTNVEGNIHFIEMEDMQYYLPQKIAYQLYLMDVQSIIIEGGANILNQFISSGLWDEARVFNSAASWDTGIHSPQINGKITSMTQIDQDQLTIYENYNNQ
ncbi:diaminohydroxyphosphoribosylaminopyrimidine deaminase/5-amino-6-(5-phosphoribosylamino)uracil reductase [Pedobacter cryoconitis]|uniref:Riboflavin biosynthesis protein RibD n=1 Tax=Pedobacter cryoconitis TaxID=188932 RepID=A0A7W8ZQ13_9SPHI|nr:bifunctional diaminohydroxyphosphoribosylaminopyrimidine deaminase/5-amino-6-(5-phosphoribosylamino)uracil reductase RibD [Pedobacter cryoconitis]MBB5638066.1 diaminohydroxyphosphoribosylaminopyrimidine deaminase/5-amino-6-(5-phosphoribosylamino)uracil reductase [Pedobacter cryoconitis]MBB6271009.1 diaminohydroxyphosphoribosylaminopyrimidine deaminase/5-amino-6-(5-phosphoribosylamino)uracil reductase [Pedobacter cryoconitis]